MLEILEAGKEHISMLMPCLLPKLGKNVKLHPLPLLSLGWKIENRQTMQVILPWDLHCSQLYFYFFNVGNLRRPTLGID